MARGAIGLFLDVPSDSFDVRIEPVLPRDLQGKVGTSSRGWGRGRGPTARGGNRQRPGCTDLVQTAHLTVRDARRVLGLSHQRITQLLKAASGKGKRGVALALLAPADPTAMAPLDHSAT